MSETSTLNWACDEGRYHVQPWIIPFVLDPETSEPMPRTGVRRVARAFYDVFVQPHWGGVISGDEITIDWDTPCRCGRTSVHIAHDIMRYSEKQGVEEGGRDSSVCGDRTRGSRTRPSTSCGGSSSR